MQLNSYGGMIGTRSSVPGQTRPAGHTVTQTPDTSVAGDLWQSVANKLGQTFDDTITPFTQQGNDTLSRVANSMGNALFNASGVGLRDLATQSKTSVQGSDSTLDNIASHAGGAGSDAGVGTLVHDNTYTYQAWWANVFTYPYTYVNDGGPGLGTIPNGRLTPGWLQEPVNACSVVTQSDEYFPILNGFPGLCSGTLRGSIMSACQVGPRTLLVQATANMRWLCRYYYNLILAKYAGANNPLGDTFNNELTLLLQKVADCQTLANQIYPTLQRLEVETIGGFTALGVGAVYAASWLAGLLASVVAELAGLLTETAGTLIADLTGRASTMAAGGETVLEKITEVDNAIGNPDTDLTTMIEERLSVALADGTKQKLSEFLGRCTVAVGGVSKNLLAECYVKDKSGQVRTVREALNGMVFTEPTTNLRKHFFLHRMGIKQNPDDTEVIP